MSEKKFKISLFIIPLVFMVVIFGLVIIAGEGWAVQSETGLEILQRQCEDQSNIWLQIAIPIGGKMTQCISGFPAYVQAIYNLFIGVVGILAVIMIMAGGFQWLLAAGNAQRISGAKTTIISAIMGLVLALTSYTILNLVNPDLLALKINLPSPIPTASETNIFCLSEGKEKIYTEVGGQDFQTIVDFSITGEQTKCGKIYYIKDNGGATCEGQVCDDKSKHCFNKQCIEGDWFGQIKCDKEKCVDGIYVNLLCRNSAGEYKFTDIGGVNTDETAVDYKIRNINKNYTQLCGSGYEPKGIFLSVQIKDRDSLILVFNKIDDWRGLSAKEITAGFWEASGALGGCYGRKPSEYTNSDWNGILNELMPLTSLDKLPIIYNIIIPRKEAFNQKWPNCQGP
ncbi:hypothetical protein A3B87_00335 [Candidatus Kuenenbacteria bacterium RIFCSPHIGHO2_02_FULL_39_13]|uniref:Uncharacterized protein n=1 Tax=Candidatus Kuenenbacteria bacterium RIFCSPHIGHO2_02_FULL_39_13 TaxID=1798561 RepID=A0A1F6FMQ7_9BACT|nr:MAG: hypothetical protein A3B87_00335 [Candidatus Kuenenbacteria bacterium RIFCSPHIGHO2_02_FULL_39_13]